MKREESTVRSPDGLDLFWRAWLPEGAPKGALLFVHGLGEHSGRYRNPADYFVPRGWACYGLDYRAHGRSPGRKVHINAFDDFLADVGAAHDLVLRRHAGSKTFLVGHSQGGLISILYALRRPQDLPGVVISSPALGIHPSSQPNAVLKAAAGVISKLAPGLLIPNGLDATKISHDKAVVDAYVNDPLVSTKVSARWFTEFLGAIDAAWADAGKLRVPMLLMQSGEDRLVDPEATRRWAARAPKDKVEFVWWEGLYHEMFNEPEKEKVFARVEAWLEGRLAG